MPAYELPDLVCDYGALEPHCSGEIVELHHDKHHAAYVKGVYDHQGNIGNGTMPLLALDMWEHAYHLQYENLKADWVEAFWRIVNWNDVAERLDGVRQVDLV